jgi:hypothetical protein
VILLRSRSPRKQFSAKQKKDWRSSESLVL